MNLLKKSFISITLITLIASSNVLQAAQTDAWMNYLTSLGSYFAANITKHKELAIGGTVVASAAAAYYLLKQNYPKQKSDAEILQKIKPHAYDWLVENKNRLLVSKSLIDGTKSNSLSHENTVELKHAGTHIYKASMHIDLNTWTLIDTITFKGMPTTVQTEANISYDILNNNVKEWIIDSYKQLISDAKRLSYNNFFDTYLVTSETNSKYAINKSKRFDNGIGYIKKPTEARLAFYRLDKKTSFLLMIYEAVRNGTDTKNLVIDAVPVITFRFYPDTTYDALNHFPHYIGNMRELINNIWSEVITEKPVRFINE